MTLSFRAMLAKMTKGTKHDPAALADKVFNPLEFCLVTMLQSPPAESHGTPGPSWRSPA